MDDISKAPVVELANAFDTDYMVGPPPTETSKRPNENSLSTKRQPKARSTPSASNLPNLPELQNPLTFADKDAVAYTPNHPSLQPPPNSLPPATTNRRGARRNLAAAESQITPSQFHSPRLRPALLNPPSSTRFMLGNQAPYLNGTNQRLPQPTRIPGPAHSNQTQSQRPNLTYAHANSQPKFGSAPNFTTFTRGNIPGITSQAPRVRTAYQDLLKHIQMSIPNSNINDVVNLLVSTGANSNLNVNVDEILDGVLTGIFNQLTPAARANISTNVLFNFNNPQPPTAQAQPNLAYPQPNQQNPIPVPPPMPTEDDMARQDVEADANQDEEYHEVETYSDYQPAKLHIGRPHPDPVVETSSLATVEPPDVTYQLRLPQKVIDNAYLSALQLESVIYASQQHGQFLHDEKTRRGFLIGDGAGVGKGRTIAGIIYENYLCGRKKSIWFSVSTDLKLDAERDLKDIGAKIPVHLLGKFAYGKKISADVGVIFTTYSGLVSKSQSIRGPQGTRLGQLVSWAGSDFDGVIVFDECHKAKNISMGKNKKKPTKAAELAVEIQNRLPKARVVYASATGASETKHLGYMVRLGIWGVGTPYGNFNDFCQAIERRGVGAMELVAVDLKMRGSYIARQLSFKTTSFTIQVAPLTEDFIKLYDECADMWQRAFKLFSEAQCYIRDKRQSRVFWSSFWAAHQKFFKYLCIGSKVPLVVDIAKRALIDNKCVVIGLQSTGEAKTLEALEDGDINEFVSTARATFESLIDNHFPVPPRRRVSPTNLFLARNNIHTPNETSSKSSTSSSNSTVDETWRRNDIVKFIREDGQIIPRIDKTKKELVKPRVDKVSKGASILNDLVKEKETEANLKSSRALRAKRRALGRKAKTSRIKRLLDDSDTELSSCSTKSGLLSTSSSSNTDKLLSDNEDSDVTYCGPEASDSDETDEHLSDIVESESDGDSDIIITAVKPRKQEIIFLSDDDEDDGDASTSAEPGPTVEQNKRLNEMQDELYSLIDNVGPRLPNNTLDDLIDRLGGPTKVAEMTGRKGRLVKDDDGCISYCNRNDAEALDNMNIAEKERFMNGEKYVAIISEAASSGISLQADRRVANKRRRVHITIELPWSADRAIQQFGRTHRSNQLSGPEYVFVISELSGEKRFASIVAKRLESLGALTHGDRRATTDSRDLSQFNIASRFSKQALDLLCRYLERDVQLANIKPDYPQGNFLRDAQHAFVGTGLGKYICGNIFQHEPTATQVNHFLNRLLGMRVHIQNAIFKLFTDYTEKLIARKKVSGQYDAGILELNNESGKTHCDMPEDFYLKTKADIVKCTIRNVRVERGISWDEAVELLGNSEDGRSAFYTSYNPITRAQMVYLIIREPSMTDMFRVYKPNTGRALKPELYSVVTERGQKADRQAAEKIWTHVYNFTDSKCVHLCYFKSCKRIEAKLRCDVGLRHRNYCILSGGILVAWPYLERKVPEATAHLQIVRLKLDATNRVIGPIIHQYHVDKVKQVLKEGERGVEF